MFPEKMSLLFILVFYVMGIWAQTRSYHLTSTAWCEESDRYLNGPSELNITVQPNWKEAIYQWRICLRARSELRFIKLMIVKITDRRGRSYGGQVVIPICTPFTGSCRTPSIIDDLYHCASGTTPVTYFDDASWQSDYQSDIIGTLFSIFDEVMTVFCIAEWDRV